jgi:hypothetical protein
MRPQTPAARRTCNAPLADRHGPSYFRDRAGRDGGDRFMKSMIIAGLILLIGIALPFAIIAARKSARGKGRMSGVVLSIGLAFSILFDPRKQEVIERTGKSEDEGEDRNKQGEV